MLLLSPVHLLPLCVVGSVGTVLHSTIVRTKQLVIEGNKYSSVSIKYISPVYRLSSDPVLPLPSPLASVCVGVPPVHHLLVCQGGWGGV